MSSKDLTLQLGRLQDALLEGKIDEPTYQQLKADLLDEPIEAGSYQPVQSSLKSRTPVPETKSEKTWDLPINKMTVKRSALLGAVIGITLGWALLYRGMGMQLVIAIPLGVASVALVGASLGAFFMPPLTVMVLSSLAGVTFGSWLGGIFGGHYIIGAVVGVFAGVGSCAEALKQWDPIAYCLNELIRTKFGAIMWASRFVQQVGPKAIPTLIDALKNGSDEIRFSAGFLLHNCPDAVPLLIEALEDDNTAVRTAAIGTLRNLKQAATPALPLLVQAMSDSNAEVRVEAAFAVAELSSDSTDAVGVLAESLSDAQPDVRVRAARCLGFLGQCAHSAVPALMATNQDGDPDVRKAVSEVLAKMKAYDGE